jgi:hypothetical protein
MGLSIYRVIVSLEEAKKADPNFQVPWWFKPDSEGKSSSNVFQAMDGSDRLVVAYPAGGFDYMHLSCVLPNRSRENSSTGSGSWFDDADLREILDTFADFTGVIDLLR